MDPFIYSKKQKAGQLIYSVRTQDSGYPWREKYLKRVRWDCFWVSGNDEDLLWPGLVTWIYTLYENSSSYTVMSYVIYFM